MADDETTSGTATAVLERDEASERDDASRNDASPKKRGKKQAADDSADYELNFETPFGKIEFEVEPADSKAKRDRRKREKAEAAAVLAAAKAASKAAKRSKPAREKSGGRGGTLLAVLLVFTIIAAAIAVAIWLFARPGPEEQEQVPDEYRNREPEPVAAAPQGIAGRLRNAVRAGRQASREAQTEQERRFEDLTRGG